MAGGAGGGGGAGDGDGVAGGAVPRGNAMSPPELAGDAPVVDVGHPLHVGFAVHLGDELDVAVGDGGDGVGGDTSAARVIRTPHLRTEMWGTRFCGIRGSVQLFWGF